MFRSRAEHIAYIEENFPEVTDARMGERHWDFECSHCKVVRGFNVLTVDLARNRIMRVSEEEPITPKVWAFMCPVCKGMIQWLMYNFKTEGGEEGEDTPDRYFRITSIPALGSEDIDELPREPPQLRTAYRQAIRAMNANAYIAAAAMFRRALQVITRNVLGAKPGNLANELKEIVGKVHNGVIISTDFANIGYIVKEAGNQGAHPDHDPDLLEFSEQDARDLQNIFLFLVSELFVAPAAMERARADFMSRRKIIIPQSKPLPSKTFGFKPKAK
jgi:hypothetical protein